MEGDSDGAELLQVFNQFDVDGSGGIDATELRDALAALGLSVMDSEQCEYMLRKYDNDRGATLDLEEFEQLVNDMRLNSVEAMQSRMALRAHPHVLAALDAWWGAAWRSLKAERPADSEESELALMHDAYVQIMCKIFKAMVEPWDEEDALATAESEWENDRRGLDHLDAELFKDSIFELADLCATRVARIEPPRRSWLTQLHRTRVHLPRRDGHRVGRCVRRLSLGPAKSSGRGSTARPISVEGGR